MKKKSSLLAGILHWTVYWVIILGIYLALSYHWQEYTIFLLIPISGCFYWLLRLVFGFGLLLVRCQKLRRIFKMISIVACILITAFTFNETIINGTNINNEYISDMDYSVFHSESTVSYDYENDVYTVRAGSDTLRILQLTDIHIGCTFATILTDRKAYAACYETIKKAKPDLIIVTGDINFATFETFGKNNYKSIGQFCDFMNHVGIPWMMTYGNHDTEAIADYDSDTLYGVYDYYSSNDNAMLFSKFQPNIYGRNNQYLRLENADGSLNHIAFLLDSNDYLPHTIQIGHYDSVHQDQIAWYQDVIDQVSDEQKETVRSFVFMHIPLHEYADAKAALDAGSSDAIYLFGKNEEGVSCPDNNSLFFDSILDKGSTDAVFVGHDHLNNMGIRYKGVDLIYGKSIDYLAYPGIAKRNSQRGGTLITLLPDKTYTIEQIDL